MNGKLLFSVWYRTNLEYSAAVKFETASLFLIKCFNVLITPLQ